MLKIDLNGKQERQITESMMSCR